MYRYIHAYTYTYIHTLSVKDRAALALIEDAEKRGVLKPGGTVVEGSNNSNNNILYF